MCVIDVFLPHSDHSVNLSLDTIYLMFCYIKMNDVVVDLFTKTWCDILVNI